MIVVRVLWVVDVVILAKQDLNEREDEEEEEDEEEDEDKGDKDHDGDPYDDYYGDTAQISDKNFIIYFAIQVSLPPHLSLSPPQASIMAMIVISMWVTCVLRAYRFRQVVEIFEGPSPSISHSLTLPLRHHSPCVESHPRVLALSQSQPSSDKLSSRPSPPLSPPSPRPHMPACVAVRFPCCAKIRPSSSSFPQRPWLVMCGDRDRRTGKQSSPSALMDDSHSLVMECLICQETFQEDGDTSPFVLICGHSFCRADLNKLSLNGTENFPCPICKCLTDLNNYENRFPPKNFTLIEQMEYLNSKSITSSAPSPETKPESQSGLCAECKDNESTVFCQECQVDLCVHCNGLAHKPRILSTHTRIPIKNKPPPQHTLPMCPLHPDEKLKLFCDEEKCQTAICYECCSASGGHKDHRSARLEVVIAAEKGRLSAALEKCLNEIEKLQSLSESRSEFVAALLRQEENFLHELRSDVESCVEAVRAKEVEITEALRVKVVELIRGIRADLAPVTETHISALALCQRADEAKKTVECASFVCSTREVIRLLEASVKRSVELISKSSVSFEQNSLRYLPLPPLESSHDVGRGPLAGAVLSALSLVSNEDPSEVNNIDMIVSLPTPLYLTLVQVTGTVVMDPDQSQVFRTVRVKAGGTLTVKEYDGSSGGELRLEASTLIIEPVSGTATPLCPSHLWWPSGRDNRCVWEGESRRCFYLEARRAAKYGWSVSQDLSRGRTGRHLQREISLRRRRGRGEWYCWVQCRTQ
jgi:hypothetical protein